MADDTKRGIKVYLDTTDYSKGVDDLINKTKGYTAQLNELEAAGKGNTIQAERLRAQIEKSRQQQEKYNKEIEDTKQVLENLSGVSYNKLLQVQAKLRKQLRNAIPDTKEHSAALEQNRRVTEALARAQSQMRVEVGAQSSMWNRATGSFNKYAAIAAAGIAAITGVTLKLNQLREKRDQRESGKADLQALTGLNVDDISWLEQEAVKLSTTISESGIRITQSATEILEAYKLVGSAKPELLDNKEALAAVTEQTLILASASGMKLTDAVNGVTLALNQYGADANQAARYTNVLAAGSKYGAAAVESITRSINKSGVAAASAGVPIEQLVGSIETLAEKGLKDEVAGTGLKKFFLTLQTGADETNPAIVGLEKALENLQQKQLSAAQIKKMFGEEGYNVASVLINEADKVKKYTEAVTDSVVAMEQANIKSQTAEAIRAQAKNRLNELGIELMDKLSPSILAVTNGLVSWSNKMVTLIAFIVEHGRVIGALVTAIVAYNVAIKALVVWEKIHKAAVDAGTWSVRAFNTALKLNPWGLVISGITAVISYFTIFKAKTDENTTAVSTFNEELERTKMAMDNISNVKLSAENMQFLTDKQKQQLKADAMRGVDQLDEMVTKGMIANKKWYEEEKQSLIKMAGDNEVLKKSYLSGLEHDLNDRMQVIAGYLEEKKKLEGIIGMIPDQEKPKTSSEPTDDKAKKEALQQAQTLYVEQQAKLKTIYAAGNDENLQTEKQYQDRLLELKKEYLNKTIALAGAGSKEAADAENQLADIKLEEKKARIQADIEQENQLYQQLQDELKALYASGNDENLNTAAAYNEALEQLALMHLERMLSMADLNAEQKKAIERQLLDFKIKCLQDEEEARKKQLEKETKDAEAAQRANQNRLEKQRQDYARYGQQIGDVMGQVISGQEDALAGFADTMLDVMFDVLGQIIEIEIAKATARAVAAQAAATAESMATPDSVLTFGASGAARAAILGGLIMGALAAAKSALKGLIPGRSSKSSSAATSSSDAPKSATVKVQQWATGKYDVIGADDGKKYNNIPYIGTPQSGIVQHTALISENGGELIINAGDLQRLQHHVNYPLVLQAINESRQPVVQQRAQGNYDAIQTNDNQPMNTNNINAEINHLIGAIKELCQKLKNLKAYVVLRDLEETQEIDRKSKEVFTKKNK